MNQTQRIQCAISALQNVIQYTDSEYTKDTLDSFIDFLDEEYFEELQIEEDKK